MNRAPKPASWGRSIEGDPPPSLSGPRWEVRIPDWRPSSLNELLAGGHWGMARLKKRDREFVQLYTLVARVPRAEGKRRISLVMTLPKKQRRWDIDAFQKSLLDAAKHAGLVRDDNPKWAEWGGVEYDPVRFRLSTTIVVEDI